MPNPMQFKPATFFDAICFQIPVHWTCIREPEGHWGCYEEDKDTGTVWVGYDVFRLPIGEDPIIALQRSASGVEEEPSIGNLPSARKEIALSSQHIVVHRIYATDDEGELLYFSWWSHFVAYRSFIVSIQLNLVLSVDSLGRPDISKLAERIDYELMNADIRPGTLVHRHIS